MLWKDLETELVRRGLLENQARDLIWTAISDGPLSVLTEASMVEDQTLTGRIPDSMILSSVQTALSSTSVITLPVSGLESQISPTLQAFRMIIAATSKNLFIISPYIDAVGVEKLKEPLTECVARGVKIRLITRETKREQSSRSRGLKMLASIGKSNLKVRDYHTKGEGMSHVTSVHAKLLMADDKIAYVGSAEMRGNALKKNFEIGAILQGDQAIRAGKAFKTVWNVSDPISSSVIAKL